MAAQASEVPPASPVAKETEALLRRDPALAKALDLEARGDARLAAEAYRSWIDAHSKDQGGTDLAVEALLRFAELESDARLVEHYLSTAPLATMPQAGRARVQGALAALLDSLGEVADAQAAYEQASRSEAEQTGLASRRSLLRSAALLYEQGLFERAEAQAREVLERSLAAQDRELAAECRYLLGRAYAASARPEEALAAWRSVVDGDAGAPSAAGACLGLWALATALGRTTEAQAALAILESRYGSSPEAELERRARGSATRASASPSPSALLEPYGLAAVSVTPAPGPAPPKAAPPAAPAQNSHAQATPGEGERVTGPVAVLAGSYTNRENAVVQARELTDKDFAARIVETTVGGRRYYRVLVGEAGTQDEAMALMRRLKDAGFESVPLPLGGNG